MYNELLTLLRHAPHHPSGFAPVAVVEGPPLALVYYHDPEMLEVTYVWDT